MSRIPGLSYVLPAILPKQPGPVRPGASPAAGGEVGVARDVQDQLTLSLSHLAGVLSASRAAVHSAVAGQIAQPRVADAQAAVDAATHSVRDAEDVFENGGYTDGPGFNVVNVSPDVASYRIQHAALQPGETMGVSVVVTQSAQQGGLYLSFGAASLDLAAANSSFTIDIGGRLGTRRLTFQSGTTLTDMATAINSFEPVTGMRAAVVASGMQSNGLRLESDGFGGDSFASVRVVSDGGISRNRLGLYNLASTNFNAVNPTRVSDFHSGPAASGYTDWGLDIGGTINGHAAVGHGLTLGIQSQSLAARITLTAGHAVGTANAQTLGALNAFVIERD